MKKKRKCMKYTRKIEEPDRITGRAHETRISIVQTVEVRLKDKKYNDVEDIKTHIFC